MLLGAESVLHQQRSDVRARPQRCISHVGLFVLHNALPVSDLDIAAELRRQLEESRAKVAELEALLAEAKVAIDEGRAVLQVAAEQVAGILDADTRPDRWSRFWFAAWGNANRLHADAMMRIIKLEKWLRESGDEATRLQTALSTADEEIGALTRALDLARAGERCTEVD